MTTKSILNKYKKNILLRVFMVALVALILVAKCDVFTVRSVFSAVIWVVCFEYFTFNYLYERDFYPADLMIDKFFPDRESISNKVGYAVIYFSIIFSLAYVFPKLCS